MAVCVVEHVVLFRAREDAPKEALEASIHNLRALRELEGVIFLHAGPATAAFHSSSADLINQAGHEEAAWTHALYGRYRDRAALDAYSAHPRHLEVVAQANAVFQAKMALDWEALVPPESIRVFGGAAARIAFAEWKSRGSDRPEVCSHALLATIDFPGLVLQHTAGPNFSPGRARGYHWGFAAQLSKNQQKKDIDLNRLAQVSEVQRLLLIDVVIEDMRTANM